jgi:hypothetical protein
MRLVGIAGPARAGKDSIANWLLEHRRAFVVPFALPLKQAICTMFSLPMDVFTDPAHKEAVLPGIGRSPRYLAQTLGTEWGRNLVGGDVWVHACERRFRDAHVWGAPGKFLVVPDVRFANEAAWVREHGTLLHVVRRGADGNVGIPGHASEAGIPPVGGDILIENYGTLDELHASVAAIFPATPEEGLE